MISKGKNYFEIIVGTFVLLSAVVFISTSLSKAKISSNGNYYFLIAKFDDVSGISAGSDVKISGIKIGTVQEQFLDEKSYRAALKIGVEKTVKLPIDSSAKIVSEGLLGTKFVEIQVGSDDELLKNNDEIEFTQSSVNLESLLGRFIFSSGEKSENSK